MLHNPIYSTEGKTIPTWTKYSFHINAEMLYYKANGFLKYLGVVPTMHTEHYKQLWNAILNVVTGVKHKGSCGSVLCLQAYIISFETTAVLQEYKP
jgi:hypothetical protein